LIGILGGVFDPIHIGHLRMAIDAMEKYHLEQIRFIPCKIPVDKKLPQASMKHRLTMLTLALKSHKKFILDTQELKRKTPSYMLLTLKELHKKFPRKTFGLIIGADRIDTFSQWYGYKEILTLAELIIMPRDLSVSSTQLRESFQLNKSTEYLLPNSVIRYIQQHHLYSGINK
jgi:nicotinate-nucleotide adenylyltransferase